jgi:hypothetical protein
MISDDPGLSLQDGMARSGMRFDELWLGQLALGGEASRLEVEAYVLGLLAADPYQHDLLAQALNECFLDRGEDHPVGYWSSASTDRGDRGSG